VAATDPFSLAGKRVLVTGGTRGIGRAISAHFVRAGAHVIANYVRDDEAAGSLRAECAQEGHLEICRADVSTVEGVKQVVDAVGSDGLSALVHAAATGVHRPLSEMSLRHWDFTFALNARALFALVNALRPRLASGSSVVALSSEGAIHAFAGYGLVGPSKAALESLCRHMAVELAPAGIRVNVLSPGTIPTDATRAFPDAEAYLREATRRSPRGRLTTPAEVAMAAHFLCCDGSVGVTGVTLAVDGGQRIVG
jgi:enoyl-[acyl-carrier protein] reductase III